MTRKISLSLAGGRIMPRGRATAFAYFDVAAGYAFNKHLSAEIGIAGRQGHLLYAIGNGKEFDAARPRARLGLNYNWGFHK